MADEKQQPIITVYDPAKEVKEALATLQKQQKMINWAMVAVVLVVAVGFIAVVIAAFAIFIDDQNYAAQRYNEYIELIESHEQELQSGTPDQKSLDTGINEEVESNQEATENDTPPNINKKE